MWLVCCVISLLIVSGGRATSYEPLSQQTFAEICTSDIIRIVSFPIGQQPFPPSSLVVVAKWTPVNYTVSRSPAAVRIVTSSLIVNFCLKFMAHLKVVFNVATELVQFLNLDGSLILQEFSRDFVPTTDMGSPSFGIEQSWRSNADEALYGLGQYQNGFVNYKHAPIRMVQVPAPPHTLLQCCRLCPHWPSPQLPPALTQVQHGGRRALPRIDPRLRATVGPDRAHAVQPH
jgi:hypothetical protein